MWGHDEDATLSVLILLIWYKIINMATNDISLSLASNLLELLLNTGLTPLSYCYSMALLPRLAKPASAPSPEAASHPERRRTAISLYLRLLVSTRAPNFDTASFNLWYTPSIPFMMVSMQVESNLFFYRCWFWRLELGSDVVLDLEHLRRCWL